MYIPTINRVEEQAELLQFMQAHNFATLVSNVADTLYATHVPLTITDQGEEMVIQGHLAKANPQWQELTTQQEILVIFQGPHAYISPTHYAKWESVPTWNYMAVHAYGAARLVTDDAGKLASLAGLIASTEPTHQQQWEAQSEKFRSGLLNGIVAFEITISRLEGKYKLSQNRPVGDREQVAAALVRDTDSTIQAVGHAMQKLGHTGATS